MFHIVESDDDDVETLRTEARQQKFLVKPFGFGARMCVGMRLAEYEIYAALAKVRQMKDWEILKNGRNCVRVGY